MKDESRRVRLSRFLLPWILATVTALLPAQSADRQASGSDAGDATIDMRVGFYVTAISEVDWRLRKCLIDFYWWIRYPASVPVERRQVIEQLELVNADVAEGVRQDVQERKVVQSHEGEEVYVAYRTSGRVYFDADFRRYPFDVQRIPITIEHASLEGTRLRLLDDAASYARFAPTSRTQGVAPDVRVADLEVLHSQRIFTSQPYVTDFGDPDPAVKGHSYARAQFVIEVGRPFVGYLVKILIPLCIILLLAYLVFYVPAQSLEVAAGLTVTSLLACIAFQITVTETLPDVGYLMTSDRIFYVCYLFIMLAMAQTVFTFNLEQRGRLKLSMQMDITARWLFPVLFAATMAGVLGDGFFG